MSHRNCENRISNNDTLYKQSMVFNSLLDSLLVYRNAIAAFDEIALAKHTTDDIQPARCNEAFIGKDNFNLRF